MRSYGFSYNDTAPGRPSLLSGVTLYGKDGTALSRADKAPASSTFLYHEDPAVLGFAADSQLSPKPAPTPQLSHPQSIRWSLPAGPSQMTQRDAFDLDGDGIPDLVLAPEPPYFEVCSWRVYRGHPDGFATSPITWQLPDDQCWSPIRTTVQESGQTLTARETADLDGDGVPDLIDASTRPWTFYRGRADTAPPGFEPGVPWDGPDFFAHESCANRARPEWPSDLGTADTVDLVDFDGDGRLDLVEAPPGSSSWKIWRNTGTRFAAQPEDVSGGISGVLRFVRNATGGQTVGLYDLNGDGLPDQVRTDSGAYFVRFNHGHSSSGHGVGPEDAWDAQAAGTCGRTELRVPEDKNPGIGPSVMRDFFDINGDGLPDIVDSCGWSTANKRWWVVLNRGAGFADTALEWPAPTLRIRNLCPPSQGCDTVTVTYTDVFDIDGDGLVDVVDFSGQGTVSVHHNAGGAWCASSDGVSCAGGVEAHVAPNPAGGRPDLLTQMENGIGGTTSLEYRPSTQWDNTDQATGASRLPFALWTVTRIARDDGLCDGSTCTGAASAHEVATTLTYAYGLYEPAAREFRGFRTVQQSESAPAGGWQRRQTSWFHQDAARKGKLQETRQSSVTGGADGPVLHRIANLWLCADPTTGGGSPADFHYGYDERHPDNLGRLTTVTDRSGTTNVEYDVRGRTVSETRQLTVNGRTTTAPFAWEYDTADHLTTLTYPDGEAVPHTYGTAGQLVGIGESGAYAGDIEYDIYGRLAQLKHGNGFSDKRTYADHTGGHRLATLETKKEATAWLAYSYPDYTATGRLEVLQDSAAAGGRDNSATYGYDGLGRLRTASGPPVGSHTYAYDPLGNLTAKDGSAYVYEPYHPHRPATIGGVAVDSDANGNRTGARGQTYAYDAENRLTGITPAGVEYRYDDRGRRTAQIVSGGGVTRYYGRLAEATGPYLTKYYYAGDLLVASQRVGGTHFAAASPEPAIRLARVGAARPAVVALVRDDVGQGLLLVAGAGAGVVLFAPWRRRRVVGVAVRHGHVVGLLLVLGLTTLPVPIVVRPAWAGGGGGAPPTPTQTPPGGSDTLGVLHYHADHLGSTQLVTRMSAPYDYRHTRYGAYGEVRGHYGATPTPRPDCGNDGYCREFTGYDTEPRSGLEYAQARFYDPQLGLFLTHDPAREYASPYSYVGWDPVNGTDPSGAFDLFFWVAVAIVAGFAAGAIQAAVEGAPAGEVVGRGVTGALSAGVTAGIGAAVVGPVLQGAVVGPLASVSGWSEQVVQQAVHLTALGGSVVQAAYDLSQADYSGLIGLGLTIGLTYTFASSAAQGGSAGDHNSQLAIGSDALSDAQNDLRNPTEQLRVSAFDRFMEFIRTRGVERTVDQPIRNVQAADQFSDLPIEVQKFDARGAFLRFLDRFSEHADSARLPSGYHVVTRISGGPAFVHFDAINPLVSNTATLLHIHYEGVPGALPVEYIPSTERFVP